MISDRVHQVLVRLGSDGSQVSTWGSAPNTLAGEAPQIGEIAGVAVTNSDWYVLDRAAPAILDLDEQGRLQKKISLASLDTYGPNGLAVDADGKLYVADTGRSRILVFTSDGNLAGEFGTYGSDLSQLKQPMAISAAPDGGLYVADWENARIVRWQPVGNGWKATAAWSTGFRPWSVAVDDVGRVYVPDTDHGQILVYRSSGRPLATLGAEGLRIDVANPTQLAFSADRRQLYVLGNTAVAGLTLDSAAAPTEGSSPVPVGPIALGGCLCWLWLASSLRRDPGDCTRHPRMRCAVCFPLR